MRQEVHLTESRRLGAEDRVTSFPGRTLAVDVASDTLPAKLASQVRRRPYSPALVAADSRRPGMSYGELWHDATRLASALAMHCLPVGAHVGIFSENRSEWILADIAIMMAGLTPVPMHAYFGVEDVAYVAEDCRMPACFVSERTAGRLRTAAAASSTLSLVVHFDDLSGDEGFGTCECRTLSQCLREGDRLGSDLVTQRLANLHPADVAAVIYTSGTTGRPKGVMLTQKNLAVNSSTTASLLGYSTSTRHLSYLPLSHSYEHNLGCHMMLGAGACITFARDTDGLVSELQRVRPDTLFTVPHVLQRLLRSVRRSCTEQGVTASEAMREITGGRIDLMICAGAPLAPELGRSIQDCGVLLREGYGLTETSPVLTFTGREPRFGTVGQPIPGVELKIDADGQVLARGPNIMKGYRNLPAETAAAFDDDGFFRTGDLGRFDGGDLVLTGRCKQIIVTATGRKVHPQPIETRLCAAPEISQAVVVGEGRPHLAALIVPEAVADGTPESAATCRRYLSAAIDRQLADRPRHERILKFMALDREFTEEREELTSTLKLRREVVLQHFASEIEAIYADSDESTTT